MSHDNLILDRYEPISVAGEGGFGTVEIAWDPRIQRKVAIKTIKLTAQDAYRAALPGAQAVSAKPTADRWHGAVPWDEYLAETDESAERDTLLPFDRFPEEDEPVGGSVLLDGEYSSELDDELARLDASAYQVTSLAHIPGLDEARTAAMLSDQRIVTVYDFEVRGRYAYLIMEYVEGITLSELLLDYPDLLTLDMVAAVFDSVAGALEVAHDAGVLHLDIKPDNILINPQGNVKVTDFGLATLADASGTGTTGGGTIGYMPLEQMRREHLDARTDEWSLASVTYEMLTGDNPFRARNLKEAERAIEDAELILPSLCWRDLDAEADDVVFYALDPDCDERYDTVADFAEEMDKFLGDAAEGHEQLALVVEDALGYADDEFEDEYDEELDGELGRPASSLRDLLDSVMGALGHMRNRAPQDDLYYQEEGEYDDYYDDEPDELEYRTRGSRKPHEPLASRVPDVVARVLSGIFAGASSGFVTWFSLANMRALAVGLGAAAPYALGALVLALVAIGALMPHVGALVSYCLLGIALILNGHPVVGAVLLVAVVAWWYTVGHEGRAAASVALSQPPFGAVGLSAVVPLLSGAALRPLASVATSLLASLTALLFASFGTNSLLGWDAMAHWSLVGVSVEGNLVGMLTRVSTWAIIVGWLLASVSLSIARLRKSRIVTGIAIVLAAALVIASSLVFASPSPQTIVPPLAAAIALLAVLV